MLTMSQINNIKDLHRCGYTISEISRKSGYTRKTVRKYLEMEDFSPAPPTGAKPSILDPYKETINEWLKEDQKHWHKQHHTAKRVYDRLCQEQDYKGGYDTVRRYVKKARQQTKSKANQELIWEPGVAQVDFGEADFYENGLCIRKKFLTVSFPYSNDAYSQVFGGETSECVCEGLQDIFEYIGGIPSLLIFDNATGVGKRIGDKIHECELFGRFRAHHRFRLRFCNPYAGYEKGHVESKVKYNRKNLFVPVPRYTDIHTFNRELLDAHLIKASEVHYKKGEIIADLFKEDQNALLHLPNKPFNVCRYDWFKADGYGKVCIAGKHHYSTKPEFANQDVLVGLRAHYIDVLYDSGEILVTHPRKFGSVRTDTNDHTRSLAMLSKNSGAWFNSGLRKETPDALKEYLDNLPRPKLKNNLKLMNELADKHGFHAAVTAMEMATRNGRISSNDASVIAERITGYGIDTPPEVGPPLSVYDEVFFPVESIGGDFA